MPPGVAPRGTRTSLQTVRGRRNVWMWLGPVIGLAMVLVVVAVWWVGVVMFRGASQEYSGLPASADVPARDGFVWRSDSGHLAAVEIPESWTYATAYVPGADEPTKLGGGTERAGVWLVPPAADAPPGAYTTVEVDAGKVWIAPQAPQLLSDEYLAYLRDEYGYNITRHGGDAAFETSTHLEGYRTWVDYVFPDEKVRAYVLWFSRGKDVCMIEIRAHGEELRPEIADAMAETLRLG